MHRRRFISSATLFTLAGSTLLSQLGQAKAPVGTRILIVGAGIAGLCAAYELSKRGFQVEIREAASLPGGRLHTRTEQLKTGPFQVEHGLHMWFHHYYNFQRILQELGVWDRYFVPFEEVYFQFEDYEPETMKSVGPYPLNLAGIVGRSPNLNILEAAATFGGVKDVIFYDHSKVYEKFDAISFVDWARETHVNQDFYNVVMEPAASVTLNDVNRISAAEMIFNMHYYFISDPKAFHRRIPIVDHGQAVIQPLVKAIQSRGGILLYNHRVPGLRMEQGRAVGVIGEDQNYEHIIVATDIGGTQSIIRNSANADSPRSYEVMRSRINNLRKAPAYHVLRVWLDRPTDGRPFYQSVIETPQFRPINLIALYHMIEVESQEWADRTGGSVLEFHLYNTPEFKNKSAPEIWASISRQAFKALPELAEAVALDFSLGSYENFTSYEVGQGLGRPSSRFAEECGIQGLSFAGDWVHTDRPTGLMERAASTGLEAANRVLVEQDLAAIPLKFASSHGPGLLPKW